MSGLVKLREALLGCSTGQLRRIADAWNLPPDASLLRRELVDLLSERIGSAVGEPTFWASLAEDETRILGRLLRARGHHESALLERRLLSVVPDADDETAERIGESVERLVGRGLAFRVFEADGAVRRTALVLPDEVLAAAETRLAPTPTSSRLQPADEPLLVAGCDLRFDLFVLASALRREARAAASRALAGRQARTVAQVLAGLAGGMSDGPGEPTRRWRFLLWVGKRAGWLADRGWPAPDDEHVERLLADPRAAVNEALAVARPGSGRGDAHRRQPDLVSLHADALQVLGELEPGVWYTADDVMRYLAEEVGPPDAEAEAGRAERAARQVDEALQRWLAGRWYWLGLVNWGHTEAGWSLISPQPAPGTVVPARASGTDSHAAEPCSIVADFQLTAPSSADLQALYRCERYLSYRGSTDGVRRYDLTPASVSRGLRLGGDAHEVRTLLARLFQADLPPSWDAAIERWTQSGAALRLEPRVLLIARNQTELDGALDVGAARQAIAERLSDRHAVVALDRVAELLANLAAAGQPVDVDPALRVDPRRPGEAASLTDGVVAAAWVSLDVLRRLGTDLFAEQRDLTAALASLEAVLPASTLEVLERRSRTIAALVTDRRAPRSKTKPRRRLS